MASHPSEGNKLLRSTEMAMVQMFLNQECAYDCVKELGELGAVQFLDLQKGVNVFQRSFVSELKRGDELERKLRYLASQINEEGITVPLEFELPQAPNSTITDLDIDSMTTSLETELREVNKNLAALRHSYIDLMELKCVLHAADQFFAKGSAWSTQSVYTAEEGESSRHLNFVTGVIERGKVPLFDRVMWRSCRGNVFVKIVEIPDNMMDPETNEEVEKSVFICFYQGSQLEKRVKKICDGLGARTYPCNEKASKRHTVRDEVTTRLSEMEDIISQTVEYRMRQLNDMSIEIRGWIVKIKKWRAIYYTMSKFSVDETHTGFVAEGWVRVNDLESVRQALVKGATTAGCAVMPIMNRVGTAVTPPTHHYTNKLTHGYQVIIDAYGVANYQEINPAIFTVVTFPFLFGIMFGDIAHGFFFFLFGLYLIYKEKHLEPRKHIMDEIALMLYYGRYIILMMGVGASYAGLLYNEIYSKGLDIFGSSWIMPNDTTVYTSDDTYTLDPSTDYTQPYFYGIDPMWIMSENMLTFLNSYKMKMAVIIGLSQMTFGLFVSLGNYRYFGKTLDIWFTFVPQLIFLWCIIGYMCFLIFYKWFFIDSGKEQPSILIAMIDMFLSFGETIDSDDLIYEGQEYVQMVLVVIALCMVPIMFAAKPLIEQYNKNKDTANYERLSYDSDDEELIERERNEAQARVDIWVNQAIHTIEFCLGVISNTASYLRLWALSLAHSELSAVLWDMTLYYGFTSLAWDEGGFVLLFFIWAFWAVLTVVILLCMEGLSAFLHALRLHWVEFQNKFYGGEGYKFLPFSFRLILENEENLEEISNM